MRIVCWALRHHRWETVMTPEPQPGVESLRRTTGWRCTRCPAEHLFRRDLDS